jgi:hypothetical protein
MTLILRAMNKHAQVMGWGDCFAGAGVARRLTTVQDHIWSVVRSIAGSHRSAQIASPLTACLLIDDRAMLSSPGCHGRCSVPFQRVERILRRLRNRDQDSGCRGRGPVEKFMALRQLCCWQ